MIATRSALALALASLVGSATGCVMDMEELATGQQETNCPYEMCGINDGFGRAFAVHIGGAPNHDGIRVIDTRLPDNTSVQLGTENSELTARRPNGATISGGDLVGTRITFLDGDGVQILVTISDHTQNGVESWVWDNEYYPTYYLTWRYANEPEIVNRPLCDQSPWTNLDVGAPTSFDAVILPREAYDWEGNPNNDLANDPGNGEAWFTIACAGGSVAKKKLMGYDLDFTGNRTTTRPESHAAVNMINARYCGGTAYTFSGVPVWWQNDREWFSSNGTNGLQIEAIWGLDGKAVCVNTPRIVSRSAVTQECAVPYCTGIDPSEFPWTSYVSGE